jgi:hypothetical protein
VAQSEEQQVFWSAVMDAIDDKESEDFHVAAHAFIDATTVKSFGFHAVPHSATCGYDNEPPLPTPEQVAYRVTEQAVDALATELGWKDA